MPDRRNAYNMVLHKFGDRLYKGLVDTISEHLTTVAAAIESAQLFLEELNRRWQDHNKSMQMIRDILMYMVSSAVMLFIPRQQGNIGVDAWLRIGRT